MKNLYIGVNKKYIGNGCRNKYVVAIYRKEYDTQMDKLSQDKRMTKKNILVTIIGSILTFIVVRLLIGFVALEYAFSVIPGWHTIVLAENMTLTMLTIILLTLTLAVMGLFKIITKTLQTIWSRLTKN